MKRIFFLVFLGMSAQPASAEFSLVSNEIEPSASQDGSAAPQATPTPAPAHKSATHARRHVPGVAHDGIKRPPKAADQVSGFGSQVPLAFAIRQMVPDGYEIVLQPPADPDALVDWHGGKSWTQALADSVKALGLSMIVDDKTITIHAATDH